MTKPSTSQTQFTTSFDLVLPPDPELLRVVRLVASGLASLAPLGLDEVEAVRVAADELVAALIQASDGGAVTITFERAAATISIRGTAPLPADGSFELDPLTERILDTVATSHEWRIEGRVLHGRIDQAI